MVTIGAIGDIHARVGDERKLREMFDAFRADLDVLILPGDLTDSGVADEAQLIGSVLADLPCSILAVLGNHDFHSDQHAEVREVLEDHGVIVLDGEGWVFENDDLTIGFAGAAGFGGGFRPHNLESFGERHWKVLVEKSIEESKKLDRGLTDVENCGYVIAITHYSPTTETLGDEPEAIYPFLGSSELGDAMDRHDVLFGLHGHAHRGCVEGRTVQGTAVFNVARPIIETPLVWQFDGTERSPEPERVPNNVKAGSTSRAR